MNCYIDKYHKILFYKMFNTWKFEHCITPTNAQKRLYELKDQGYEARLCVKGHAYGVEYRETGKD